DYVTILLLSVVLYGCSQSRDTALRIALDRLEEGRDISFGHGRCVLHVEKRVGSSLQGVRVVSKESDGQTVRATAESATLSQGADRNSIRLVLHDARIEKASQTIFAEELVIN